MPVFGKESRGFFVLLFFMIIKTLTLVENTLQFVAEKGYEETNSSQSVSASLEKSAPTGLPNWGSNCYMNAVFQLICRSPGFSALILRKHHQSGCEEWKNGDEMKCILCMFEEFGGQLLRGHISKSKCYKSFVRRLLKLPGMKRFSSRSQECAFEFFTQFMDLVDSKEKKAKSGSIKGFPLSELFWLSHITRLGCQVRRLFSTIRSQACGDSRDISDSQPYLITNLEFGKTKCSVVDCLERAFRPVKIEST